VLVHRPGMRLWRCVGRETGRLHHLGDCVPHEDVIEKCKGSFTPLGASRASGPMSIAFQCKNCGAAHRAKAEHAGRRTRCPKCGQVLGIPDTPAGHTHGSFAGAIGAPEGVPPLLSVTCACGKVFHARAEHAGKRAKCARCGNVLTIPGAVVAVNKSKAAAPSQLDEEVSQWMLAQTPPASSAPEADLSPITAELVDNEYALALPPAEHGQTNVAVPTADPADKTSRQSQCPHCGSRTHSDLPFCSLCHGPLARDQTIERDDRPSGKKLSLSTVAKTLLLMGSIFLPLVALPTFVVTFFLLAVLPPGGKLFMLLVIVALAWAVSVAIGATSLVLAFGIAGYREPEKAVQIVFISQGAAFIVGLITQHYGLAASLALPQLAVLLIFWALLKLKFWKAALIWILYQVLNLIVLIITLVIVSIPILVFLHFVASNQR